MTIWTVDVAGVGVDAVVGEEEPHATANRLIASRTVRSRLIIVLFRECIFQTQLAVIVRMILGSGDYRSTSPEILKWPLC